MLSLADVTLSSAMYWQVTESSGNIEVIGHLYVLAFASTQSKHWPIQRSVSPLIYVSLVLCVLHDYQCSSAKLHPICHSFQKSVISWIRQIITARIWNWAMVNLQVGVGGCSEFFAIIRLQNKHYLTVSCRESRWNHPILAPLSWSKNKDQIWSVVIPLYIAF